MKLSVSAYQAGSSSAQKILSQASHTHHVVPQHLHHGPLHGVVANYGSTSSTPAPPLIIPRVQPSRLIPAVMVEEVDGRSSPGADGGPSGAAGEDGDGGERGAVAGPAGAGASGTAVGAGSQQPSTPADGGGHSDMVDSTFGRQTAVRPPPETTSPSASASTASSASAAVAKGKGAGKRPPPPSSLPQAPREGRRGEEAEEGRKGDGGGKKSSDKSPGLRTKSNQRWMKLRTTVQLSGAISSTIQKKTPLKREDSFLKRFSTRQIPETQETMDTGDDGDDGGSSSAGGGGGGGGGNSGGGRGCGGGGGGSSSHPASDERRRRRRRVAHHRRRQVSPRSVINPDENFYFYWLFVLTACVLYNLWTLIVRQSFPELQAGLPVFWRCGDAFGDTVFLLDVAVQFRTGYLEQGLMVYDSKKLAAHYIASKAFLLDLFALTPLDLVQLSPKVGSNPILRFPRFLKMYRLVDYYYMVESRTVYPNLWRVVNLVHILLILAHWFGCFYYLLSEAEGFQGDWVYPHRLEGDYATLTRKYLGSLYWSTLTLTTIGDLPTPETNADGRYRKAFSTLILPYTTTAPPTPLSPPVHHANLSSYLSPNSTSTVPANSTTASATSAGNPQALPRRGLKSRLLQFSSNRGYVFTIVSYLIGVFIFATIVGQVGNVITNRNANRLEFERLLDGAKTYMRHHKVPGDMKRRVLRWYDYSWSRGRIQGGGDINTALGLLPDKLKTELALHVNLSVLKKVTIFQECQPEFLHDLVLKMKAYIFTPGDLICRKGEVAREMFIIADGILEVMSETGRVLTTMKAGDFFGEIGILNLDGLNKRTADVRSVGYSELFSLSREDVLAAMKDYPEAQEILQALGRKRLMEARNSGARGGSRKAISRSSTKAPSTPSPASTKSSPPALGKGHSKDEIQIENEKEKTPGIQWQESTSSSSPALLAGTPGENTGDADGTITGKKIVERLKSDVMGLREVLRKSKRIATRGMRDEAIELQPLTKETPSSSSSMTTGSSQDKSPQLKALLLSLTSKHTGNWDSSCSGIKGALRRMSHVKSDDSGGDVATNKSSPPEVSQSSRRKRSRGRDQRSEEQEEEDEEGDRRRSSEESQQKVEVIGEGLPLLTRLRMLREKEERERKMKERRRSSSKESDGEKAQEKESQKTKEEEQESKSKPVEIIGEGLPLFTRLRMLREKEEREAAAAAAAALEKKSTVHPEKESSRRKSSSTSSGASQTSPPPIAEAEERDFPRKSEEKPPPRAGRPLIQRLLLLKAKEEKEKESEPERQTPATGAKPPSSSESAPSTATDCSESLENAPGTSTPTITTTASQISVAVVPPRTRDLNQSECKGKKEVPHVDNSSSDVYVSECCEGSKQETCTRTNGAQISSAQMSAEDSVSINQDVGAQPMCASETSPSVTLQVEDEEGELVGSVSEEPDKELCSAVTEGRREFRSSKPNLLRLRGDKKYASIDDLSPEYNGLPFVKKLKILNDRQRLAELDKSSSLDSGDFTDRIDPCYHNLSRSFSDTSYISHIGPASSCYSESDSPHKNSVVTRRDKSDCDEDVKCSQRTEDEDLRNLSPESNETLERQNLKSILKKLSGSIVGDDEMTKKVEGSPKSEEKTNTLGATKKDLHQLMRAPTVEGYAARHSKLTKSVTFNRDTLASPPRTPTATTVSPGVPVLYTPDLAASVVQEKSNAGQEPFTLHQSSISTERPTSLSSTLDNRHNLGQETTDFHSVKEDECFGGVLLGIKQVIQSHVDEIQSRFQEKFLSLESEVKKRDEIIFFLEKRISELEQPKTGTRTNGNKISVEDDSSSSSDGINPFMRGDSADTVVTADLEDDIDVDDFFDSNSLDQDAIVRQRGKKSSKRKLSHSLSEEASLKEDDDTKSTALSLWLSDRDGDLKMSFSSTSSSSSFTSSSPSSSPSSSSQEENDDVQMSGRNKDWEVQMLARELERRQGVKRLKEYDEQCDRVEKAGDEDEELESHHRLARRFLRLSRSERELLERLLGSEEDADEEESEDKIVSDSSWHHSRSLKQLRKKARKSEGRRKGAASSRKKNGTKVKGSSDSKTTTQEACHEADTIGECKKRKVWIGQQVLNARSLEEAGSASNNIPSSSTTRRRAASTGQLPFLLPLPSLSALSNSFRGIAKAATAGMGQASSQIPEPDPEKAVVTISGSGHSSSDCPLDTTIVSKPSSVPKL